MSPIEGTWTVNSTPVAIPPVLLLGPGHPFWLFEVGLL